MVLNVLKLWESKHLDLYVAVSSVERSIIILCPYSMYISEDPLLEVQLYYISVHFSVNL